MCFNKAIVQSMFKHVASENGPLVLILQSYSQIFIVKHIDRNLVELIWTTKNCEKLWKTVKNCEKLWKTVKNCEKLWSGDKAFRPVKKFYELRNFTNTKRKIAQHAVSLI